MYSLLLLILATAGCIYTSPIENDWRIVGGTVAANGSVPYQVSLRDNKNRHFCGGSIISPRTVLTAAHCLVDSTTEKVFVVVGTNQLNNGGTKYESEKLIINSDYDTSHYFNDIAVVILKEAIEFTNVVKSIPTETEYTEANVNATLSGWGKTSDPGSPSNDLLTIELKTISYTECQAAILHDVHDDVEICTYTKSGEGTCNGDSGGALVANGTQVGIVSWGVRPCAAGYPDVYTRVSSFDKWIKSNIVD